MARREIVSHTLDIVKGQRGLEKLDVTAQLSDLVDPAVYGVVFQGRVAHVDDEGELEMGCVGDQMAVFLTGSSDEPDTDVGNSTDDYQAVRHGQLSGLVASGGFEIATTEFDSAQTYLPNQPLRAVASNTNPTTGGRLTNQSVVKVASATPQLATAVCGVVSKNAVTTNSHRIPVLSLWTVYQPGATGL